MVLSLNFYHSKSSQCAVVLQLFHFGQFFPILTISAPAKVIVAAVHGAGATTAKLEIMDSFAFDDISAFLTSDCVPDNFRHDHSPFIRARCDAKCDQAHKPGTTCSVCGKYTRRPSSASTGNTVSVPSNQNGTVTVNPSTASKGETVTITTKPSEGYELGSIEVLDKNGDSLKLKDLGNGKYSFVMPDGKVSVEAEFVKTASTSFADVPANAYFADAVKWAVDKGVTNGLSDTMFGPYESCTRAQIVTFLWRAAGSPEPKAASNFTDLPASAYYAKAVAWAIENGITNGMTETTFAPNATCTRGQSVTFLYRALKGTASGSTNFTDAKSDAFYADAVNWAVASDVTNGTSNIIYFPRRYSCWRKRVEHFAAVAVNFCAVPLAARQAPETGCLPCKLSICFYLPW
ncbi:MAG: S-layer homology domain-containing protein [Hydrogeniiclostridium mannosilyticum]